MFSSQKTKIIFWILVVIVLLAAGVILGINLKSGQQNPAAPSDYSAVYLSTGDIYFGKLSWLPWPRLDNVWFIRSTAGQNNQPQLGIAPLTGAFWGPVDSVYLNPKNIILWTSLRQDSQLVKAFTNPAALQQQQSAPAASLPPSSLQPATSTKK